MPKELLSVKNDYVFCRIFGETANLEILADFLSAVLDFPKEEYDYIEIVDPHLKRMHESDKLGILDVKIHTKSGAIIDVEMQVEDKDGFKQRVSYYNSRMLVDQVRRGEDYTKIERVVSIVVTDFEMFPNDAYHNRFRMYDKRTHTEFSDISEINTLELPKIPAGGDGSGLCDWLRFITARGEDEMAELAERNPQIKKATAVLRQMSESEEERWLADEREKAWKDYRAEMSFGVKKERLRGEEKLQLKCVEIARNLKRQKVAPEVIAAATGLSPEQLESISS
jgi:predicted transposase/invertase (TIGR01784 family)